MLTVSRNRDACTQTRTVTCTKKPTKTSSSWYSSVSTTNCNGITKPQPTVSYNIVGGICARSCTSDGQCGTGAYCKGFTPKTCQGGNYTRYEDSFVCELKTDSEEYSPVSNFSNICSEEDVSRDPPCEGLGERQCNPTERFNCNWGCFGKKIGRICLYGNGYRNTHYYCKGRNVSTGTIESCRKASKENCEKKNNSCNWGGGTDGTCTKKQSSPPQTGTGSCVYTAGSPPDDDCPQEDEDGNCAQYIDCERIKDAVACENASSLCSWTDESGLGYRRH